jgi:tetratricopeptide (TPR) repeat protein
MTPKPDRRLRASARVGIFRALLLVVVPAAIFLGLEGGLRLAGFGHSASFLIPDDQPGFYRTNPDFLGLFVPASFELRALNFRLAKKKPANTVRVFVLGESAVQGTPVPVFSFATQLRAQLRARYPGREVEVINAGIVAINSHVIYQIARDLAAFSPDVVVVYMGNNEVVGPYGPGCAYLSEMPPLWLIRLSVFVRSTRTGQLIAALVGKLAAHRKPPVEWGGMSMFVDSAVGGDDPRLEAVYRNLEANLRDIVRVAAGAGAKTILCTVVSNLKDCAPLLSRHRPGLSAPDLAAWQAAFARGRVEWLLGEGAEARRDLSEAWRLDPQYADTAFMLGSLELSAGEIAAARRHLMEAEHWDALRFRPDPRINDVIRNVAASHLGEVRLLDAAALLGSDPASTVPPAGRELLCEHVHFNWDGNYQMARWLAEGVETALFGDEPGRPPWLDSPGCAAAVGYTTQGKLTMLRKTAEITRHPPFTNQLTYGEDQSRSAREIGRAEVAANSPEALQRAKAAVEAAIAGDPGNPNLSSIAEELDIELGDTAGALAHAHRVAQLLPLNDLALFADEASLLSQLGRHEEAEKLLQRAATVLGDPDKIAPPHAALYARMKRFDEGRAVLERAIARHPAGGKLRLVRGTLARMAGDKVAAEREFRAILDEDPGNQSALEALVSLLGEQGETAKIESESLAVAEQQTRNQLNNLRVANIFEARGDDAQSARFLLAARRSGLLAAADVLRLARKLYRLRRLEESLLYLAEAKRLSVIEEDPESAESIGQLIGRVRAQMP